jgi:hypothetical protein
MARPADDHRLGRFVEDLFVAPVAVVYPHVAHASMTTGTIITTSHTIAAPPQQSEIGRGSLTRQRLFADCAH